MIQKYLIRASESEVTKTQNLRSTENYLKNQLKIESPDSPDVFKKVLEI